MVRISEVEEYEAHLGALGGMPSGVASTLRDKLLAQRAWIDGQLVIVNQVIERHQTRNGTSPPAATLPEQPPLPRVAGPAKPSRRMTLLKIMAEQVDTAWPLGALKVRMIQAGSVPDSPAGNNRIYAALSELKGRGEIEPVAPGLYQLTARGIAVARQ